MAGSLHGSARTTPRAQAQLQTSQEKISGLAQCYGLSRDCPKVQTKEQNGGKFAKTPIGYVHIDTSKRRVEHDRVISGRIRHVGCSWRIRWG